MTVRLLPRLVAILLAIAFLGSCHQPIWILRIGSHVPEQSAGIRMVLKPWLEKVTADLPADIQIKAYWGGSLGRDAFAQYDLVRHGVLDLAWVIPSYTPGQFPQIDLLELPFLADTAEEASVIGWRLEAEGLMQGTEHVKILGVWTTDVASIQTIQPVDALDQLARLKIRTAGSVQATFISQVGAIPETMSATEMNEALQRGAIDGLLQAWSGIRTYKTDRLMRASFEGPFGALPFLLVMNRESWERLPASVQESFMRHGGEDLARLAGQAYDQVAREIRADVERAGRYTIIDPSAETIDGYRARFQPLHKNWMAQTPNGEPAYELAQSVLTELRTQRE